MADDPRITEVDALAVVLMAAWTKAEPEHSVTKHPVSYVATFADMARAALAADRLRALLADEDRLIDFLTEARWKVDETVWRVEFGRSPQAWADAPEWAKDNWRAETRKLCGPVLAALREVAGL